MRNKSMRYLVNVFNEANGFISKVPSNSSSTFAYSNVRKTII